MRTDSLHTSSVENYYWNVSTDRLLDMFPFSADRKKNQSINILMPNFFDTFLLTFVILEAVSYYHRQAMIVGLCNNCS